MVDFSFDNMVDNLQYIDTGIKNNIRGLKIQSDFEKSFNFVDECWEKLTDCLCNNQIAFKPYLEFMKTDIILSVYAAVTYKILKPVTILEIINAVGIKKMKSNPNSAAFDSTRQLIGRAGQFIAGELTEHNLLKDQGNIRQWEYFKDLASYEVKGTETKVKVFCQQDFYSYLRERDNWLFTNENVENGLSLEKWYNAILKMDTEIQGTRVDRGKADIILDDYIFEQLFSFIQITSMLNVLWKTNEYDFYDENSQIRKQNLELLTYTAGLPRHMLEVFSTHLISTYDVACRYEFFMPLKGRLSVLNYYRFYIMPLCQTLLYEILQRNIAGVNNKLEKMRSILTQYIECAGDTFAQEYNRERYIREFGDMKYPKRIRKTPNAKTEKLLSQKVLKDSVEESFGMKFTKAYLEEYSRKNYFDLCRVRKENGFLTLTQQQCVEGDQVNVNKFVQTRVQECMNKINS